MPTYEYQCKKCGKVFEHFQSMTEDPLTYCIIGECHGKVERLISAGSGLIFKGSGFYETDYKKSAASTTAPKEAPAACPSCPHGGNCPKAGD
ncbi:TPA: FmdB family transcriptional regulator [Candidatus Sumerlaeota bacterium]|jgi:putative FmdB family regulatory protein|nr:FmdB family transcriptional regulator [Candidatus Sumerlaeota bacterium]